MLAEESLRAKSGGVDSAFVGLRARGRVGAPGLHERCSACTSVDLLTARSLSPNLVRPPWHGRGQGFESPKLHGSTPSGCLFEPAKAPFACDRILKIERSIGCRERRERNTHCAAVVRLGRSGNSHEEGRRPSQNDVDTAPRAGVQSPCSSLITASAPRR